MTAQERIERAEGLAWLVSHLGGDEFGGTPACGPDSGVDPELFHPISEEHTHQIARAKQVCGSCPVQGSCLQQAMSRPETGIWGGATEDERRRLRTARIDQDQQNNASTTGVAA